MNPSRSDGVSVLITFIARSTRGSWVSSAVGGWWSIGRFLPGVAGKWGLAGGKGVDVIGRGRPAAAGGWWGGAAADVAVLFEQGQRFVEVGGFTEAGARDAGEQ